MRLQLMANPTNLGPSWVDILPPIAPSPHFPWLVGLLSCFLVIVIIVVCIQYGKKSRYIAIIELQLLKNHTHLTDNTTIALDVSRILNRIIRPSLLRNNKQPAARKLMSKLYYCLYSADKVNKTEVTLLITLACHWLKQYTGDKK